MCIGELGWGPRIRHLILHYIRPDVPLGLKLRCKQEDRRRRVYTYIGRKGRHTVIYGIYKRTEVWYERQIGQDRQLGHSSIVGGFTPDSKSFHAFRVNGEIVDTKYSVQCA